MFASRMYLFVEFSSSGRHTASLNDIGFGPMVCPPNVTPSVCLSKDCGR